MWRPRKIAALGVVLLGCLLAGSAAADVGAPPNESGGPPPASASEKAALAKDAVCTGCHDKSWPQPVLSIYQTPHGNRADSRTPTCWPSS